MMDLTNNMDFSTNVVSSARREARHKYIRAVLLTFQFAALNFAAYGADLTAAHLTCEYRENPLGVNTAKPQLGWMLESKRRGEVQTAYEIFASSSESKLRRGEADLWDSGKIGSRESLNIEYAGRPLVSGERVWWAVRVWDAHGNASPMSSTASFETGLLSPSDWQAQWIQRKPEVIESKQDLFNDHPAPLLRKEFSLDKKVVRARAYVSGLGYYELRLNGQRVGDRVLDPGWTSYAKRVLYSSYDVTAQVKRGHNALGIMLGNGWFNPLPLGMWGHLRPGDVLTTGEPRAIMELVVEFADGTKQVVGTDDSWRTADGPVLRNSVYLGEVYDARREQTGWDESGFDDSRWGHAELAHSPALGPLISEDQPPIRITRTLKAVAVTEPKPGVFIFDFGQNFAGWTQLKVKGPAGTRVRLRSGELLYPDGTLNGMTSVAGQIKRGGKNYRYDGNGEPATAFQLDEYVLKGRGTEVFTPHFTFHGFRYVEVTGFPGKPTVDSLAGLRLNADVQPAGSFECSNERLNKIQQAVLWTELSNLFSVQSDCPHREKFGYGGDIVASGEMAMLNFDMATFYTKVAKDFLDAVRPNGGFTETAPYVGIADQNLGDSGATADLGPGTGPVDWGVAEPWLLAKLYQYYGNRQLVADQYEVTRRWIELLRSKAQGDLLDNGISDHESLAPKPRALTGSAFYYLNLKLFARLAAILGKMDDAAEAEARANQIAAAFNHRFLDEATGRYDIASQACQAIPLQFGLVPPAERGRALEVLTADIVAHDKHLTTGIFGTKYMLNALTDSGKGELAYDIVNQKTFPGWGYMLENGATTLWEHWEGSDNTYSHNHPMFGSVSEWFYKALGGIQVAPDAVGFDKIIIRPQPAGDLTWVKCSYHSVRGKIESSWERKNGELRMHVTIPPNTTAIVYVPAKTVETVTEGGKPAKSAMGLTFLRMAENTAVFAAGSGHYEFVSSPD